MDRLTSLLDIRYGRPREAQFIGQHLLRYALFAPYLGEHSTKGTVERFFVIIRHALIIVRLPQRECQSDKQVCEPDGLPYWFNMFAVLTYIFTVLTLTGNHANT